MSHFPILLNVENKNKNNRVSLEGISDFYGHNFLLKQFYATTIAATSDSDSGGCLMYKMSFAFKTYVSLSFRSFFFVVFCEADEDTGSLVGDDGSVD